MAETKLFSYITCTECGYSVKEQMPENSCRYFWECPECSTVLKPKKGDCCVYCSYGDVPCPPVQGNKECC